MNEELHLSFFDYFCHASNSSYENFSKQVSPRVEIWISADGSSIKDNKDGNEDKENLSGLSAIEVSMQDL